jgi:hypothetical protein
MNLCNKKKNMDINNLSYGLRSLEFHRTVESSLIFSQKMNRLKLWVKGRLEKYIKPNKLPLESQ